MLTAYAYSERGPVSVAVEDGNVPPEAGWVDLFSPTAEEEKAAEAFLGAEIPTREEAQEIEFSSRFYVEDGVVVMTAVLLAGVDEGEPFLTPFSFALGKNRIVTLRYANPMAFRQFLARSTKADAGCSSPGGIFMGLVEAFIDRTADVLERITQSVDRLNRDIFTRKSNLRPNGRRLSVLIGSIGVQGDLASKVRESLASVERLIQYAAVMLPDRGSKGAGIGARLKLALRDSRSLEDHVNFVLNKITFLLDATLGLVSNEQNQVLGVLTIVSTILLPPMLIGTVYGMNFHDMPELNWRWAYPIALGAMVLSAVIPFVYFKWRRWL